MIQGKTIQDLKQVLNKYRTQVKKTNKGLIVDGIAIDLKPSNKNSNSTI